MQDVDGEGNRRYHESRKSYISNNDLKHLDDENKPVRQIYPVKPSQMRSSAVEESPHFSLQSKSEVIQDP